MNVAWRRLGVVPAMLWLLVPSATVTARGALEGKVLEIEREVPVEVPVEVPMEVEVEVPVNQSFPLQTDAFPDVPAEIGEIGADAGPALSLEQREVVRVAFRRVYQEHLDSEFDPGMPYEGDQVRFWWGRDVQTYMLSQNVGVGGDSSGEGWGMTSLAVIAMHPSGTQAFLIADEFITLYHRGRDDEHGGNGPDGFGYPVSDVYYREDYKAQAFSKGLMIVRDGAAEFLPDAVSMGVPGNPTPGEIPELVGSIREDSVEKFDEYATAAMTDAFRREYTQSLLREFEIREPHNNDEVHEWAGRDVAPVSQNFASASPVEAWGIPGLAILMMNPDRRRAYLIKDEFVVQYSTARQDGYGGSGPDGYGYPLANEYRRFGYAAQPFSKGLMILENGVMDFIPNPGFR